MLHTKIRQQKPRNKTPDLLNSPLQRRYDREAGHAEWVISHYRHGTPRIPPPATQDEIDDLCNAFGIDG